MAKKAELIDQAKKLKLDVSEKSTIKEIETALEGVETTQTESKEEKPSTAKAGKRSAKAQKEVEEKEAKEARKASGNDKPSEKPKNAIKPAHSRLERRGKKFREAAKHIEKGKEYSLKEAVEIAKDTSTTKFDATVELHVSLGVDPKHADQNIRGTVSLPAGSGKTVRVAVFADTDDVKKAKEAGADIAENDEFLQQLEKEELNFDILIATPTMMAKLGKYARVLGPKGLMPNPKSGTVTTNVTKAVKESKAGKIEYRVDSAGIVHVGVGKVSFSSDNLLSNLQSVLSSIRSAKPASVKSSYIKTIYLTTSMGPSVKVSTSDFA